MLASIIAVSVMMILAYVDTTDGARGMLFPSQMTKRYISGFPLVANGTVWGGLFLLSPTFYVIGRYSWQWDSRTTTAVVIVSMVVSYAMHQFVYRKGKYPDALVGGGRPISPAGWVNVFYFGAALAAVFLFYFFSEVTVRDIVLVGALLITHIIVANHVPLDLLNWRLCFPWCPNILAEEPRALFIIGAMIAVIVGVTAFKLW